ncbi:MULTISPECIES: hypothetical protein [unclassified Oceanispirochaeta]|uniref:hypothetical protein n=1 Tax=unclassified Oceanispirochaeta TaxID=2635722 RepID=UPI000E094604|nr:MULTISPECIES: hypothetical protein [unclassified Oceanispirochaeta]MBF9017652.1 hypothetical protein [Oceanispirochaeta sp. M2]NPD74224.1 hypothetical protein [Oceanispirochaeta sp. M1]RDG29930.1 hypothetical protein DV872_19170 [Oceanispirochaeta sp. M1]
MQSFDLGKKVFFLYPPHDFSKNIITGLFREGFEIYKLNSTVSLLKILSAYPDSILVINTDYPYEDDGFSTFTDKILKQEEFKNLMVYTIFNESVSFADKVRDYIALNRPDEEVYSDLNRILTEGNAHGKREYVRYGNFDKYLSTISFTVEGNDYSEGMHDISPKALSFSSDKDMEHLVGKSFSDMKLKVGVYEITVHGKVELSRMIGGKKIYIAVFDLDESEKDNIFNFIFTSLEMGMDEIIQKMGGN